MDGSVSYFLRNYLFSLLIRKHVPRSITFNLKADRLMYCLIRSDNLRDRIEK